MEDSIYVKHLEEYQQKTNEQWGAIAQRLGVTRATINNWRNGGKISLTNRNGIAVLTGMPNAILNASNSNIISGVGDTYGNTMIGHAGSVATTTQLDEAAIRADERKKILNIIKASDLEANLKVKVYELLM